MSGPLFFDIETCSADELHSRGREFLRLAGYMGVEDDAEVTNTTDMAELIRQLEEASHVVGHGVLVFDLIALARHYGLDWNRIAPKAIDSLLLTRLVDPPLAKHGNPTGYYTLDATAKRMGVAGKTNDIRALARKHKGYDKIPVDDPEYVDYLKGDVLATREVARRLPMTDYARREHRLAVACGNITVEGIRVDEDFVARRIEEDSTRKDATLEMLGDVYGVPLTDGKGRRLKSPLATKAGKERLMWLFDEMGVKYPVTEKTRQIQTGRDQMQKVIEENPGNNLVADLCNAIVDVVTVRTIYKSVQDHTVNGRVHPTVSMEQASGRLSLSKPGLTVISKKSAERAMFLPEIGHVLFAADFSQVDMRAIAGHSQDPAYMELFQPGRDAHAEIALAVFGTEDMRHDAKAIGHGFNYGLSVNGMVRDGVERAKAEQFHAMMERAYPKMAQWRTEIRQRAESGQLLDNGFGRLMRPNPERAWTQAPALMGQGTARDLVMTGLDRMPDWIYPYLRGVIHDEFLFSVPESRFEEFRDIVLDAMTFTWRGVPITADATLPGENWNACYRK